MRLAITIVVLSSVCFSQVQGNLPQLQDSVGQGLVGTSTGSLAMLEPVNVGDVIDVCVVTYDGANTAYSVDDSLGNGSYTLTTPTQTPGYTGTSSGIRGLVYHAYKQSAFSGNNTITLHMPGANGSNEDIIISRYSGLSGTIDGTVATATYSGTPNPGGIGTIATTQTTTTNNDILHSCTAGGGVNASSLSNNTAEYNDSDFGPNGILVTASTQHAGAAGSQTVTVNTWNDFAFGGTNSFAMQTLAFKPSASIAIADTVLPDAGNNVAYSAQLHCVGGTAAQTYSLFSGSFPTGLSLNTSTGVISGTTTVNGTSTLGFRCTDGTVTSSTASLTLKVSNSVNVPSIRSAVATTSDATWPSISVQCNDMLVVIARGYDAHYTEGGTQIISGTNDYIKDDFNSTWRRVDTYRPGSPQSPLAVYVSSPMPFSGANNIHLTAAHGSAANPISQVLVISGGEMVDGTVGKAFQPGATSGTFSQSYTTVVNNTLLVNLSLADGGNSVTPTLSMSSPFTNTLSSGGDSQGTSLYSYAMVSTPAATTATTTFSGALSGTGGTVASMFAQMLIPIRPAPATACASIVLTGEKFRRQAW